MKRTLVAALLAWALSAVASDAQNLSLRAPQWAQPLLVTDVTPTTGGRAALNEEGITAAARVTIAPTQGGVARVIRFEVRGDGAVIALRRFTGHPETGWWLWGPDTPVVSHPSAAVTQELTGLIRTAIGIGVSIGGGQQSCPGGEQAYVEMAIEGRSTSATRACVSPDDPVGRLASRLSDIAGSRNDEELNSAAVAELIEADRAFAALAQREGAPAAFAEYASENAVLALGGADPVQGHDAVIAAFANWPHGARLQWSPTTGRVSARGDMGWTWGRSTYTAADGTQRQGRYITTWTRDFDGHWRFAFDAALRDAAPTAPARPPAAH
ncbi:MAG: DUF4440 domain-containing protein [Alphaproteobacteria bacterium]